MSPLRVAAGLAFTAWFGLSGCNKPAPGPTEGSPAVDSNTPAAASAPAAAPATPPVDAALERDAQIGEKLSHYVQCINNTDAYLHETHDRLLESLTPKREVNPRRWPNLRATGVVRDNCYKGLDEAATLPPKLEDVEQAAAAFRAAVDKLEPLLVDGDRYYHQGDDKDDKGAHGRDVVKQVLAGFEDFSSASKALRASVEKHNQILLANSLERVEKAEGRSLHYLCKKIVADARLAVDQFLDEKTPPADLEATLERYKKLDAELRERAEKFPQEKALIDGVFAFMAHGDFVLRDLKETIRAVRDKDSAQAGRARQSLLKSYNQMVDDSNQLKFKRD